MIPTINPIRPYRSPKIEVRESRITGRGIFAIDTILKDEIVAIKNGHILTKKEFYALSYKCQAYCMQFEDNFYFGPKNEEEIEGNAVIINHSCTPNAGFMGQVVVAMRTIEADEEVLMDNAMHFTDMGKLSGLECRCGSEYCRGIITNNDWKSEKLQKRYGQYFSYYILRKIESIKNVRI
jgi:uncharacterized protein